MLESTDFDFIRDLVRTQAAIALERDKQYLVEGRLTPLVHETGMGSISALVRHLIASRDSTLRTRVVDALTTNETSFFRDVRPFECLRSEVVPALLARRAGERQLSMWSAASSSGQEAFSMAVTVLEILPPNWSLRVLGTDINQNMVDRARQARYSQLEINRGMPAGALIRWFVRDGLTWEAGPELRRRVEFRQMNLADSWPVLPEMDIVFLRNVMIYFEVDTRRDILRRLRNVIRGDGVLFLGASETTLNVDDGYEHIAAAGTGYYRLRAGAR